MELRGAVSLAMHWGQWVQMAIGHGGEISPGVGGRDLHTYTYSTL